MVFPKGYKLKAEPSETGFLAAPKDLLYFTKTSSEEPLPMSEIDEIQLRESDLGAESLSRILTTEHTEHTETSSRAGYALLPWLRCVPWFPAFR